MKSLIQNFSNQLSEALIIGESAKLTNSLQKISNILICGMGGSGISGNILNELVNNEVDVPINICKGYFIPNYVNENTLVIISSYSGNTEETINCINMVIQKKAKVVCVTSGGIIEKIAIENHFDYILIPGNMPPRSCLGYSLIQMFYILHFNKIINDGFKNDFKNSINLLEYENLSIIAEAEEIAKLLVKKTPIIYTTTNNEAIAIRFRQQLNENSKVLCWHNTIPEMNHNELVGWASKNESLAVLILLDDTDYKKNKIRAGLNLEVIKKYASSVDVIYSKGETAIEKAIYFINLCDWISIFLAEMREIDPVEINVITELKNSLAQIID
jgi:glucose/mannose-6-phosphate isomerase